MSTERDVLLNSLATQREHVLGILEGLSEEGFRRPVLPTGWTCLSLVNHLAVDVERFWFRGVVAGQTDLDGESGWQVDPALTGEAVLARYRQEIELANEVTAATALDAAPAAWPDFFGNWRLDDFREIMQHVITETACHAGHLDAARELIDGRTWMVLE